MKAIVYERYGGPEVLELREMDRPEPGPDELLVRVHAVSLNGADAEMLTGRPWYARTSAKGLFRPGVRILASDVAGVVEAVGGDVEGFEVGDAVVGDLFERFGGLAEYVCAPAKLWVHKRDDVSFTNASVLPQAAVLALQAVRDQVELGPDSRVLVVGAGGGMGVFAVQLAKRAGANVTAVDNGAKQALLERLGADRFVDYTQEDFLGDGRRYDLIVDMVAARWAWAFAEALKPAGAYAVVGGSILRMFAVLFYGLYLKGRSAMKMGLLMWDRNPEDIEETARLVAEGELEPVVDGVYPLEEASEAFRRLTEKRANGKVVVRIGRPTSSWKGSHSR